MLMIGVYQTAAGTYDLQRDSTGHIAQDSGLGTTVLLLLMTEGRAQPEDVPPGAQRGGYWGNSYPDVPNWELGSRLHILGRSKSTNANAHLIEQEIRVRLQCLIDDGIAKAIDVDVSRLDERWTALITITQDQGRVEWLQFWVNT